MERLKRKQNKRPNGGNGGHGGSVVIVADPKEQTLATSGNRPHLMAPNGTHGSSQNKKGRNGKNLILRVPCGVIVKRVLNHDETWDEATQTVVRLNPFEDDGGDQDDDHDDEVVDVLEDGTTVSTTAEDGSTVRTNDDNSNQRMRGDLGVALEDTGGTSTTDAVSEDGSSEQQRGEDPRHRDEDEDDDEDFAYYEGDEYLDDDDDDWSSSWNKEREKIVLADLDTPGSYIVVAKGGKGGVGSNAFLGRSGHGMPDFVEMSQKSKPTDGEKVALELELKLIADIGLVGFPNAGKSSLLAAMSRATPYIAPYPFTTLHPLIGYIEYRDGYSVCAADVPGLIAGASEGRGQGHDFLRHLERTKALLYIVDAAGVDGRDPFDDLRILTEEVSSYGDGDMMNRRALVVANKMDLFSEESERSDFLTNLAGVVEDVAADEGGGAGPGRGAAAGTEGAEQRADGGTADEVRTQVEAVQRSADQLRAAERRRAVLARRGQRQGRERDEGG